MKYILEKDQVHFSSKENRNMSTIPVVDVRFELTFDNFLEFVNGDFTVEVKQ